MITFIVEPAKRRRVCQKCRHSIAKGEACLRIECGITFSICASCISLIDVLIGHTIWELAHQTEDTP